ncbi:methyltransferase [Massilia violaceinigra]|uniref:Methyltransferase n=1 Tax=Massilia violaceinigra TaxID=2045208 RepID=A0A2D2DKH4_9BURK|nr:CmcJ/NvfI family oxidoreductase [Massilia violaceinigra]ATQ75483.1 methyltransferase [Massilia violaceinigra]
MNAPFALPAQAGSVQATLAYMHPPAAGPFNYACEPPPGQPWQNYDADRRTVCIGDARLLATAPSVHADGFVLCDAPVDKRSFLTDDDIVRFYYPEVAELACAVTGATRARVFDHLVRHCRPGAGAPGFGRADRGQPAGPNGCVHNDYTDHSGDKRLGLVFGELAAQLHGRRYSIVNVWRSIRAPVLDTPLAVCDARSVAAQDMVEAEVRYPRRTGEIYLARYSPLHRWFYFPAMHPDEALVFKQYDSQRSGAARFTPHAAFEHPDAPPGVPPRVSIEARCLVIYD